MAATRTRHGRASRQRHLHLRHHRRVRNQRPRHRDHRRGGPNPTDGPEYTESTPSDTELTVAAAQGLLSQATGTGITLTSSTAAIHGTVVINADGSYTYTPDAGYAGPDSFSYTITDELGATASATVDITVTSLLTPAVLTVTSPTVTITQGSTVPTLTPSYSGFVGTDTVASLTARATCTTTATSSSPPGSYPVTCSGAVDPNYTFTYVAGSVTVTALPVLTVTSPTVTITQGSTVPTLTPSYNGFVGTDTVASLTARATCTTTATSSSPPGSYPVTCSGAVDPNYTFTYVAGSVTVTALPVLTVTSPTVTITQGSTVPTLTPSYSGFVGTDTVASLTARATCTTTATSSSPPGSYPVTCSGAVDPNYTFTYVAGSVTVTALPVLTVTSPTVTITQGSTVPTLTPSYSGFVGTDTVASLTARATCTTTATSSSPPGSYPVTCSGAVDPNYTFTYVAGSVTVTALPVLTVTSPTVTITQGSTVPTLTPSYSGFVGTDTVASLTTRATCTTTATSSSPPGSYPVTCSGAVDPNYTFTYVAGSVTVTALPVLTVTSPTVTITQGGTAATPASPSEAVPSSSESLAFTGADLGVLTLVGISALLLGYAVTRRRRRRL